MPAYCSVCNGELAPRKRTGRPALYCGTSCKHKARRRRTAGLARLGRVLEQALKEAR
jgi:hypothetical protein